MEYRFLRTFARFLTVRGPCQSKLPINTDILNIIRLTYVNTLTVMKNWQ